MQVVTRDDRPLERIDGELQIHEDGTASGEVALQRFDDQGEVTCSGEYSALLMNLSPP